MKILSFDPGKQHFAYALVEDAKVKWHGILESTVEDLTAEVSLQFDKLTSDFLQIIHRAKLDPAVDYICAERYMQRPGLGAGGNAELINLKIGALIAFVLPVRMWIIPSARWKNHMTRAYGEKGFGKDGKLDMRMLVDGDKSRKLSSHECDAIGIGLFCHETNTNQEGLLVPGCWG